MNEIEKSEFQTMQQDVKEIKKDFKEIKEALLGNDYGQDGLVSVVKKLRADVYKLESEKNRLYWIIAGASSLGALLWNVFKGLIKW